MSFDLISFLGLIVMWVGGMVYKHRLETFDHKTWGPYINAIIGWVFSYLQNPGGFSLDMVINGLMLGGLGELTHGVAKTLTKGWLKIGK